MQFIPKDKLAPLPLYLADIGDNEVQGRKTITFASARPGSAMQHTINNHQFNELPADYIKVDKINTTEEWTIVNNTAFQPIDHPFHIHINPFQVTEVFDPNQVVTNSNGRKVYKYVFDPDAKAPQCYINPLDKSTWKPCNQTTSSERIWWDVFPIPSGRNALDDNGKPILGPDQQPIMIGGYFKMRSRFDDFPGIFVLHCHILAHEDRGMMSIVAVQQPEKALMGVTHH